MNVDLISEENIETKVYGKKLSLKIGGGSSFWISELKDYDIRSITIRDEEKFTIGITFWRKDKNGHISEKGYTIEKDKNGEVSVFEGSEKLVKQKGVKEKTSESKKLYYSAN